MINLIPVVDVASISIGEVHTGLLQHPTPLPSTKSAQLVALAEGEEIRRFERPISHVISPVLLTGVDCGLAQAAGGRARCVGAVTAQVSITGGYVVQAASEATLSRAIAPRRQPWSHYLGQPGNLEVLGKADPADLARTFTVPVPAPDVLDLGGVSGRLLDGVQRRLQDVMDRSRSSPGKVPFLAGRTRLRWAAAPAGAAGPSIRFRVESPHLRTVLLEYEPGQADAAAEFCADLALHDWLLSCLLKLIERSKIGIAPDHEVIDTLRPAVTHLLHLWMPAARTRPSMAPFWKSMEDRPGLSRQWQRSVDRIRDQFALHTIALLSAGQSGNRR